MDEKRHVEIYREDGRYAAWPANYGIWSWGDEIVLGFTAGFCDADGGFHARDRDRPFSTMQARSRDGGESWEVCPAPLRSPGNAGVSADEHMNAPLAIGDPYSGPNPPAAHPGGIDFTHPDFALMCARTGLTAGAVSWFYTSTDRCRTWDGPFQLGTYGRPGMAARTSYIVSGESECTLFLTATRSDGEQGESLCARTVDGGRSFDLLSWITPEPTGHGYAIMPSAVALDGGRLLCAVRARDESRNWIDLYGSDDGGRAWKYVCRPVPDTGFGGNPPALLSLADGRLCLTYGYRAPPFSIRARLSDDGGRTWGEEVVLRDGAGNHDIGYTRSAQRADGRIVTAYYFNDEHAGERYIAATIWGP
ncbi:MAG: sialidase family protein [Dehalococcoidia bacterium]